MYIPTRPNTSNSKSRNTRLHEPCTRRAKKKPAHLARLRAGIYIHITDFSLFLSLSYSLLPPFLPPSILHIYAGSRRERKKFSVALRAAKKEVGEQQQQQHGNGLSRGPPSLVQSVATPGLGNSIFRGTDRSPHIYKVCIISYIHLLSAFFFPSRSARLCRANNC